MSPATSLTILLDWMRDGTDRFQSQLAGLSDDELAGPSLLPGWSRGHVVAHVARNADALVNLVHWAATGIETPMYADPEQRAREIEESRRSAPAAMRVDFGATSTRLEASTAALSAEHWHQEVRTAKGRIVPATEVPWLRVREVWIHAVDLDHGARLADFPAELITGLIDEVCADLSRQAACPTLEVAASDGPGRWHLGGGRLSEGTVCGTTADLLGWLIGRTGPDALVANDTDPSALAVPPWL